MQKYHEFYFVNSPYIEDVWHHEIYTGEIVADVLARTEPFLATEI
jgi:hypothetical protein